jgi:YVTN family beta-propeller protein
MEETLTDKEFSRNRGRPIWDYSFLTLVALLALTGTTNSAIIQQVKTQAPLDPICGRNAGPTPAQSSFQIAMNNAMRVMDANMMAVPTSGNPDSDFATMMIPHHQGAVDMAKAVLLNGKDSVLRRLAQEIIVTQEQEIEVMRLRLASLQVDTTSGPEPGQSKAIGGQPVSSGDRVYTADQTSETVSVIDPASNKLLGVIRLGDPLPGSLSPLYKGQLLVHGLGFSPDHKTLAVVSIGSNSITLIDTTSNKILGVIYIGRAPHEAFFTPNGKELWATVRGENYVSVIDPVKMKEIRRVQTANGPGMVLFRPDGRYAFVPSSFTPEVDVIDAQSYEVVARVPQASPFSPNLAVSADGTEVWFTLKDSGKAQVMGAEPPFQIRTTLDCGPLCNHVALVDNACGKFAYVTVGGENAVKVYRRGDSPKLLTAIPTGDLPHGIWESGDGTRVYIGLENQDAVIAIDTLANKIIASIRVGQQPQALVYVPQAVPEGAGTANLVPLGDAGNAAHLMLVAPAGDNGSAHATVSVNNLVSVDLLQAAFSDLKPGQKYVLWLVDSRIPPFGHKEALVTFQANLSGAQVAQAIGPLRRVLGSNTPEHAQARFLILTQTDSDVPALIQKDM